MLAPCTAGWCRRLVSASDRWGLLRSCRRAGGSATALGPRPALLDRPQERLQVALQADTPDDVAVVAHRGVDWASPARGAGERHRRLEGGVNVQQEERGRR